MARNWFKTTDIWFIVVHTLLFAVWAGMIGMTFGLGTWMVIYGTSSPVHSILDVYPDAAPVSGWYGPGAWWSFIISFYLSLWRTIQSLRPGTSNVINSKI
jgi:hypothetical protein